ncbi:MAG TPA: C13 family peptidase [Burkholderiales bacterium]|nr:C13 family peptidase [Burkholderiales bacterium]
MSLTPAPLFAGLLRNILSGARLALFMRVSPQDFRASPAHFAALFFAAFAAALLSDLVKQGWPGLFNFGALPTVLSQVPVILFACLLAATLLARPALLLPLAVALIACEPLFELVGLALSSDPVGSWLGAHPGWNLALAYAFILWWLAVSMRVLVLFGGWQGARTLAAGGVFVLMTVVFVLFIPRAELWLPVRDFPADGPSVADEQVFHLQAYLLEEALGHLEPERAGRPDLYFLGVASDASQDVFVREVMAVRQLFDRRFGTAGRSLVLANSPQTLADVPIATATNLRLALERFAQVMNPQEDILFLFITTHGDAQHELAFDLPPLNLQQLRPATLARMLRESGIKWKVLVVSACYSGGFVEPLRDEDTVVITAADADSASFGCESGRDYTYFGRAYFGEALRGTYSFTDAFAQARESVLARERAEDLEPSSPQIHVGAAIRPKLAQLEHLLTQAGGR